MFPEILINSPLLGLGLTVLVYVVVELILKQLKIKVLPPILIACPVIILCLMYCPGLSYAKYAQGANFISFMLGPATIALAVPLYRNWDIVRKYALPLSAGILLSTLVSLVCVFYVGSSLGLQEQTLNSVMAKSVTVPIAVEISKMVNGLPAITIGAVIMSGVLGAVTNHIILRLLRIKSDVACGVAIGACSHGIGTSACAGISSVQLAVGGVTMGLCGVASTILIPILYPILKAL